MTPWDEFVMYATRHKEWCRHVAPRWAAMLRALDGEAKRALWSKASPELQAELRRLAERQAA